MFRVAAHALQYAHASVGGVLVANARDDSRVIVDAIPLYHLSPCTPLLEAAAVLVLAYCKQHELQVVGWYHATAHTSGTTFPPSYTKLGQELCRASSQALSFASSVKPTFLLVGHGGGLALVVCVYVCACTSCPCVCLWMCSVFVVWRAVACTYPSVCISSVV
jgi:Uncharacterised protein family (UPF0172)